jgi:hypothetical protein
MFFGIYFRFDNIVPLSPCKTCLKEIFQFNGYLSVGMPFEETWPKDTAFGEIFRISIVMGLIRSLVGPNPLHDHHGPHLINAGELKGPDTHQDSFTDFRENYFDIQLSFFCVDTPNEKGGRFFIPSTQFRNIRMSEIDIYQHMRGKISVVCSAGTVFVWNSRIWHGARSNRIKSPRYMYKLRLNPSQPQVGLFNTSDLNNPAIENILKTKHGWVYTDYSYELLKRFKYGIMCLVNKNCLLNQKSIKAFNLDSHALSL